MAYTVSKIYTDHPLMDEIVYNCKLIVKDLVVKNKELADLNESAEFIDDAELFKSIKAGTVSFYSFPFTIEIFKAFGYSNSKRELYYKDRNKIPEYDRKSLLSFACDYFLENYEEQNNYYRSLNGLPEYNTTDYFVYIDQSFIPASYTKEVDFTVPIHLMDQELILLLENNGKIDKLLETYKGSKYSYLKYMGKKKIDIYDSRKAEKFDILYIPDVENLVQDRFTEIYNTNKDIYLKRIYSEAYAYNSDYYEECIIIMIISQTFADMITDVPEWYIRRDIFDIRSVQYFLESYGIEYFKEIPLKYQIRLVKNINKLIKYKSTSRNFDDILEIFGLPNTTIYKYYLFKKRLKKGNKYIFDEDPSKMYDLEFVKAKINESYDNYIKDLIYRSSYDSLTLNDKYWDGEQDHEFVRQQHLNREFTIEGTKYLSIENKNSMSEYLFQLEYFLGLVLDSKTITNDIKIFIPSINPSLDFSLSDLFLFLCVLNLVELSNDLNPVKFLRIIRPDKKEQLRSIKFDTTAENYDWMKRNFPELFIPLYNRVYGFNINADLNHIQEVIGNRHSTYQFRKGFDLDEILDGNTFYIPAEFKTVEELIDTYNSNKKCYEALKNKLDNATYRDDFLIYQYVFDQLFTKEFDYEKYMINNKSLNANTLDKVLQDRNYVLYNKYLSIIGEVNIESRKDNIRNIISDIINTLEYYFNADNGLENLFSFTSISSFNSLSRYIYLIMNFFKSYKVNFLDPTSTLFCDIKSENYGGAYDYLKEKKLIFLKWDKQFLSDVKKHNASLSLNDRYNYNEELYIRPYHEYDTDRDYDGKGANDSSESAIILDGGEPDPAKCIPYIIIDCGGSDENEINKEIIYSQIISTKNKSVGLLDYSLDGYNSEDYRYTQEINTSMIEGSYDEIYSLES